MMKHDMISKPMAINLNSNKDSSIKKGGGLWKSKSSAADTVGTPKSPITKAFDFLPWSRNKSKVNELQKSNKHEFKTNKNVTKTSTTAPPCSQATVTSTPSSAATTQQSPITYQRNIFRNGGGLIRDILVGDKLNKDDKSSVKKSSNITHRKAKQVIQRNKSLDINELIHCVEQEMNGDHISNGLAKNQRFLDDTFIENIMRAKDAYQRQQQQHNDQDDDEQYFEQDNYYSNNNNSSQKPIHHREYNDTEDEYFYHQQQELAKLYRRSDPMQYLNALQSINPSSAAAAGSCNNSSGSASGNASPNKQICFNDNENTVYLIKKGAPVNKSAAGSIKKNCDKEPNILKARLKLKKFSTSSSGSSNNNNNNSNGDNLNSSSTAATVLNNNRIINYDTVKANGLPPSSSSTKKSILQRQNTTQDEYNGFAAASTAATAGSLRIRSPSVGRYPQQSQQNSARYSPIFQRRKSLTDSLYYEQQYQLQQKQSPTTDLPSGKLYENGNSSTSSMGSAVGGTAGILNDRPKTDKPRKKLSFREPVVADANGQRKSRRQSAEVSAGNAVNQNQLQNCDNFLNTSRRTTPTKDLHSPTEEELLQSQAMRIVRTVGQAFEVCHKFNIHKNSVDHTAEDRSDISSSELLDVETRSDQQLTDDEAHLNKKEHLAGDFNSPQRPNHLELVPQSQLNKSGSIMTDEDKSPTSPCSPSREINKLKDQLEQQAMQTRQALAQLMLVREQLISETNARIEAQARTQQLLQQNRELLEHLASLGAYTEQQTAGLTTANLGMAQQNPLQMLLQATAGNTNTNLATINQQINNLGSINQQLTSLSAQLSGLNQQTQNLQNFQQQQQQQQQTPTSSGGVVASNCLTPQTPTSTSLHQSQLHLNASSTPNTLQSSSPFPSMQQLQNITTQLQQQLQGTQQAQAATGQQQQEALSKDLFQVNQELLNRLQALNLGSNLNAVQTQQQPTPSPHNSYFFTNPMSCSPSNNNNNQPNATNNNFNFLNPPIPNSRSNLTPSPMGTLSRNSYSNSPITDEMRLSIDKNLNALDEHAFMLKPLTHLTQSISNGNIAPTGSRENSRSSSTVESPLGPMTRSNTNLNHNNNNNNNNSNNNNNNNMDMSPSSSSSPRFNTVMLKVTDEAGNVTNQRKLNATPSFIQRSTSEKVPNRSQIMSQVQRTAWARHTTK